MPQPAEVGALAEELASVYQGAWADIDAQQQSIADNPREWRRRARLNELRRAVEASMDDVDAQAAQWFSTRFPESYGLGAADLGRQLGNVPFAWASPDVEAVTQMAQDSFDDLLAATTHVRDTTKNLVRTLGRERSLLALTTGQTARQAGADLRRVLEANRISAIVYRDNSRVGLGPYADMLLRTKCLPGEVPIDGARVVAAHRRFHEGEWLVVHTAAGHEFSGTPNHPMFTQRGWVALGELAVGDHLVRYSADVEAATGYADEHVQDRPATIAEVFDALAASGMVQRERGGVPDFHGDGSDGEVNVVWANGMLRVGEFAPVSEGLLQGSFSPAHARHLASVAFGYQFTHEALVNQPPGFLLRSAPHSGFIEDAVDGTDFAVMVARQRASRPSRLVCRGDEVGWEVLPETRMIAPLEALVSCGGDRSQDPGAGGVVNHRRWIDAESFADFPRAQPGQVQLDQVVSLRRGYRRGHVYNLTTVDGYLIAGGYYTGNTAMAYNAGALGFGQREGIGFYEVRDGYGCGWIGHDDSDKANGSIRSIEECAQAVLSHPRCARAFLPRPDLATAEEAKSATGSTTPGQDVDQRASEQRREASNLRRSQRRARQRREAERAARRRTR